MTNIFRFPDRAAGVVPQRLADARIALQLSRVDVARTLDVTGTTIGYYENGDRTPDMSILLRLSEILRQPISFFFKEMSINLLISQLFRLLTLELLYDSCHDSA